MSEEPDKTVDKQNKPYLFQKGVSGNPKGRPKGTVSIKTEIKKRLQANPDKLEELVDYYMNTEKETMRKLLWEMLDGKPQQGVDMEVTIPDTLIGLIKHGTTEQGGDSSVSGEDTE